MLEEGGAQHSLLLRTAVLSLLIAGLVQAKTVMLPPPPTSFMPGGISRIVHNFYTEGLDALMEKTQGAKPLFQRHWIESCKVHNGPQWRTIMWDLPMAELLLETLYPDYLPHFRALGEFMKKCDAVRPFILHAYGGVYLDADLECFRSIEDSMKDYSLVIGEQGAGIANTGTVAAAPGHPLMERFTQRARDFGDQKGKNVLDTLGPFGLTHVVQEYVRDNGALNYTAGRHKDTVWQKQLQQWRQTRDPRVSVLGQQSTPVFIIYELGDWFMGCKDSDRKCLAETLQCRPIMSAMSLCTQYMQRRPACHDSEPQLLMDQLCPWYIKWTADPKDKTNKLPAGFTDKSQPVQCIKRFGRIVGQHLFSNTWRNKTFSQASFSLDKATQGVIDLWRTQQNFISAIPRTCSSTTASTDRASWLQHALWPLHEVRRDHSHNYPCAALSLVFLPVKDGKPLTCCTGSSTQRLQATFKDVQVLSQWAQQHKCHLSVYTNSVDDLNTVLRPDDNGWVRIVPWTLNVSASTDQPHTNVPQMLYTWYQTNLGVRMQVLHMSLPGIAGYSALKHLYSQGSYLLRRAHTPVLLLELGALPKKQRHWAETAYNHLYQELGYIGHAFMDLSTGDTKAEDSKACTDCAYGKSKDVVLPPLLLGFVRSALVHDRHHGHVPHMT